MSFLILKLTGIPYLFIYSKFYEENDVFKLYVELMHIYRSNGILQQHM